MEKEVGEIEVYSSPDPEDENKKWGVKLNGKWINDFGNMPDWISKGVVANVKYKVVEKGDKVFRNIESIEPFDEKEKESGKTKTKNKNNGNIDRQSAVKSACRLYSGKQVALDEVKQTIQQFHNFIEEGEFD